MKKRLFLFLLALSCPALLFAQAGKGRYITFDEVSGAKDGGRLHLRSSVVIPQGSVDAREVVVLTPVLRALDGSQSVAFGSVAVIGRNRAKALERNAALGLFEWDVQPERTVLLKKEQETVGFAFDVPYQAWMRNAEFVCLEEGSGCIRTQTTQQTHRLMVPVLPPAYAPTYELCYVNPPAEPVKQRSESYAARLNFRVNRYEILNDYMNNATVLREVNEIIEEIRNDANLDITEFRITGYASPEGGAASNMTLSENRAKSFVNYLRGRHSISRDEISVDWKGDDWDGLRKLMQESDFAAANDVIAILDATQDAAQRKNRLKALPSYRTLLDEYYPYLRRNEYTIAYIARPFSVEEAKVIVRTKPQQLSLNEMYLVANTYPKGSPEFKQVFDVAVRMFPDSDYANLNSGAVEIENGAYDSALAHLQKVDMHEAWNNIGYIYIRKAEYARAAEYFRRAADAGNPTAARNLEELNRWMQDQQ